MSTKPESLAVLGAGPQATEVALREVLRFKKRSGSAVVLDAAGRGAMLLSQKNKMSMDRRRVIWCDLADRRKPVGLFRLARSAHLSKLVTDVLRTIQQVAGATVADTTLQWAGQAAHSLAVDGTIGLAALVRCLSAPETRGWFLESGNPPSDLRDLIELLTWALAYPAVYGLSEGVNAGRLLDALDQPTVVWLEAPSEHFEPKEHLLVQALVDAVVEDALRTMAEDPARWSTALKGLTVLHLHPIVGFSRGLARWVSTANGAAAVRHVSVHHLDGKCTPGPGTLSWANESEGVWVLGAAGAIQPSAHSAWLSLEEAARIEAMDAGGLWVRSNRTGRSVVSRAPQTTPVLPSATRHRRQATRRRQTTPVRQVAEAVRALAPPPATGSGLFARLCETETLWGGWLRVQEARGRAVGVDGVSVRQFAENVEKELERLRRELRAGQYRCQPLRRIGFPKGDGSTRTLGIACIRDRIVQGACLSLLEPLFEPTFSRHSFAFRPRRSAHQAIGMALGMIRAGRPWAVTADVRKCFDSIDHDVLLRLLARRVADDEVLGLVRHWLTADILEFRELLPTDIGIPQGESISPLMANIYLHPLDQHMEHLGMAFVRYADDILVFTADQDGAERAHWAIADFLRDTLLLELKPEKTAWLPVSAGFDFLGFRVSEAGLRVQDQKIHKLGDYLDNLLSALADSVGSMEWLAKALERVNAVIRGWRNYFGLPGHPRLSEQLRALDEETEQKAVRFLPASLRDNPVWLCRERFSLPEGKNPTAPAQQGNSRTAQAEPGSGYPEARKVPRPPAWLVANEETVASAALGQKSDARKRCGAPANDEESPEGLILEAGGRLYVLAHGAYVGVDGDDLVCKKRRVEVYRRALKDLGLVYLQGFGISVAVDGQVRLAQQDVPVVFAPPVGTPAAVVQPIRTTRSAVRRLQALRREDPDVVAAGLGMIGAKVANQAALLQYFAKYRRRVAVELAGTLTETASSMRELSARVLSLDPSAADVRGSAMGFEGHAAALYWRQLASLIPEELEFGGRITTSAEDPVNQCLNYVYGILYGEVWRAVVKAGLDPYFGLIHGSVRDQGSLVFDLIEEFRAPFGDRVVIGMLGRGFRPELGSSGLLRTSTKKKLVATFTKRWNRPTQWRSRRMAPVTILTEQARSLADLIRREGTYHPFRMRW